MFGVMFLEPTSRPRLLCAMAFFWLMIEWGLLKGVDGSVFSGCDVIVDVSSMERRFDWCESVYLGFVLGLVASCRGW